MLTNNNSKVPRSTKKINAEIQEVKFCRRDQCEWANGIYGHKWVIALLPPATKLGQGYIFTGMCDSVHGGGAWSGRVPGLGVAWFRGGVPGPGGMPGLGECLILGGGAWSGGAWWRPPQDGYCCGLYASYWNAFLLNTFYFYLDGACSLDSVCLSVCVSVCSGYNF